MVLRIECFVYVYIIFGGIKLIRDELQGLEEGEVVLRMKTGG